jgi:hypothetical protein
MHQLKFVVIYYSLFLCASAVDHHVAVTKKHSYQLKHRKLQNCFNGSRKLMSSYDGRHLASGVIDDFLQCSSGELLKGH